MELTVLYPESFTEPTFDEKAITDRFHDLYYRAWLNGRGTKDLLWLGHHMWKCPLDLWAYQEIIYEMRPDVIIECGTHNGGSALYLSSICQLIGNGRVITIDVAERPNRPDHPLLTYLHGSSTDEEIVNRVRDCCQGRKTMAILDSDHSQAHVFRELSIYKDLVTAGQYLIVEDTNINGHPTFPEHGPGPMEAVWEFLKVNHDFVVDRSRERFLLTLNPQGYLKKIR